MFLHGYRSIKRLSDAEHLRFQFTHRDVFSALSVQCVEAVSQLLQLCHALRPAVETFRRECCGIQLLLPLPGELLTLRRKQRLCLTDQLISILKCPYRGQVRKSGQLLLRPGNEVNRQVVLLLQRHQLLL
ncbi:hypothetical protein D3C76_825000 [compost metagenome]